MVAAIIARCIAVSAAIVESNSFLLSFHFEEQASESGKVVPARVDAKFCLSQWPTLREYLWTWCVKEGIDSFNIDVAQIVKCESSDSNFKKRFYETSKLPKIAVISTWNW